MVFLLDFSTWAWDSIPLVSTRYTSILLLLETSKVVYLAFLLYLIFILEGFFFFILQMTKLAIIPFTVLLETLFLKKQFRFQLQSTHTHTACIIFKWFFSKFLTGKFIFSTSCSQKIKLSLLVLLGGVGIASVTDLQLNFVGTILSLLAIVTTCVGQIVSSLNLLHVFASFSLQIGAWLWQCYWEQITNSTVLMTVRKYNGNDYIHYMFKLECLSSVLIDIHIKIIILLL